MLGVFIISVLLLVLISVGLLIKGVLYLFNRFRGRQVLFATKGVRRSLLGMLIVLVLGITLIVITQLTAATPKIAKDNSIAELRKVELNGRKEWISIRGENRSKPVLLFLAGGPGGSQLAATRYELAKLEKDFIVVNWEQPGSGKSYSAIPRKNLTPEIYVEDGTALVRSLLKEFKQEKLYLLGESWGSALGIFMVKEQPELYHAFIGTGQMVAFEETEKIDYALAMKLAKENGDQKVVDTLRKNGEPPYYGNSVTTKSATYLNYLSQKMVGNPEIQNGGFQTMRDLAAKEYGILDKVNYLRGILQTFNHVYPQLYNVDLRKEYSTLDVPVYFLLGKHDINAPLSLTEDYYQKLDAPNKEIIWFEHSGHNPWINEPERFVEAVQQIAENKK
ncbi:alpha/beta hydrolase [Enterococcus avium]|uniref:Alpha/beta hydrolase n=1 Tax=Enterococcus avium TaxID=33945 RepID=A0ABD5F6S9_ENTAV|nr:alpha/beta hydrolase [Enterococcus avium]MDO7800000.1 alpha/beta hydrolase [Enterococcus avium]MDT2396933.1 alpha/beta hydrolase [Enterococcus avium]MDT2421466.1 alpha/beta hydrolase [Enterococcus avium]MDT2437267.1 alpha/beta hydrolase [Enterococcus avium]MDT2447104.1 alpha/beta hydrolase [Enterococcus avium]